LPRWRKKPIEIIALRLCVSAANRLAPQARPLERRSALHSRNRRFAARIAPRETFLPNEFCPNQRFDHAINDLARVKSRFGEQLVVRSHDNE